MTWAFNEYLLIVDSYLKMYANSSIFVLFKNVDFNWMGNLNFYEGQVAK